jgi:hypothetical protein
VSAPRDSYREAGEAARAFIDRLMETGAVKGAPAVALAVIREISSFSRASDRISVSLLARRTGQLHTNVAAALRKYDQLGALVYNGGTGHRISWVSLRPDLVAVEVQHPLISAVRIEGDAHASPRVIPADHGGDAQASPWVIQGDHHPRSLSEKVPEKKAIAAGDETEFEALIRGFALHDLQIDRARRAHGEAPAEVARLAAKARRTENPARYFDGWIKSGEHLKHTARDHRLEAEIWIRKTGTKLPERDDVVYELGQRPGLAGTEIDELMRLWDDLRAEAA